MAAGKWKKYEFGAEYLCDGTHDLDNTSLGYTMALFLSTSNANTLSVGTGVYGDLTNEVANAFGYTTGGIALTGEAWTHSGGTCTWDVDNAIWTASGGSITARFAVISAWCSTSDIRRWASRTSQPRWPSSAPRAFPS